MIGGRLTGGTRKPDVRQPRRVGAAEGQRDDGHRRVARSPGRPRRASGRPSASSRAAGRAGTASTTASASSAPGRVGRARAASRRGAGAAPHGGRQPDVDGGRERVDERRVPAAQGTDRMPAAPSRRAGAPACRSATRPRTSDRPPRSATRGRRRRRASAAAVSDGAPASQLRRPAPASSRAATARRPGRRRRRRAAARPAGRPPRRRAAPAAARRRRRRRPAPTRAAGRARRAPRRDPAGDSTPSSRAALVGTPSSVPAGSGCRPPGTHGPAPASSPGAPARRPARARSSSATRLGHAARSNASAPMSYQCPARSTGRSLPPMPVAAARARRSRRPGRAACATRSAAARPAMPPPTTTTRRALSPGSRLQLVHQLDDAGQHVGVGLGQHAVAEVEDVPGRGPALARRSGAPRASTRRHGRRSSDGGVEVALHAPRPGRPGGRPRPAAPASRRRRRRRRPRPSAPSSSPVPTPKWIRGTPSVGRPRRAPRAECGST